LFGLKEYRAVQSLDEAHELLMQSRDNVILGGLLWMKMGRKQYHTGIDLSGLGLNMISETEDSIDIGCMTPLRQMETSPLLHQWFGPLFSDAFKGIVGVQFRNLATLGGSVYSRFGFSDVITALTALDTQIHLYQAGTVSLSEFLNMDQKRDILIKAVIRKQTVKTNFQTRRKSATDFPVLSVAVSLCNGQWKIAVGARPSRAALAKKAADLLSSEPDEEKITATLDSVVNELSFGTDQRAGSDYRKVLAKVLVKRGINAICR
jgi:CO/xanthine dehydrogenase FAD-binding subunit